MHYRLMYPDQVRSFVGADPSNVVLGLLGHSEDSADSEDFEEDITDSTDS